MAAHPSLTLVSGKRNSSDGEPYLHLLWRALEVVSVMVDNEDTKAKPAKGKQADLSPLQNCLIGIVSKTGLGSGGGGDDADEIEIDDDDDRCQASLPHTSPPPIFPILLVMWATNGAPKRTHATDLST